MSPPLNDIETISRETTTDAASNPEIRCPVCQNTFQPVRRQRYCTPACRQAAWRSRQDPTASARPDTVPRRHRRDVTVYRCGECDQRYLGLQWCQDCHRPCSRDGIGGLCPSCDEPVTVDDLLDQHHDRPRHTSKIR